MAHLLFGEIPGPHSGAPRARLTANRRWLTYVPEMESSCSVHRVPPGGRGGGHSHSHFGPVYTFVRRANPPEIGMSEAPKDGFRLALIQKVCHIVEIRPHSNAHSSSKSINLRSCLLLPVSLPSGTTGALNMGSAKKPHC